MGIVATQGPALQKVKQVADGRRGGHGIIAEIRGLCRTEQQADAAERMIRHLSRLQGREGDKIRRTWRQLAQGLGYPTEGLTDRRCRELYRTRMERTLDYLEAWGYLAGREALYEPNGEGRCILIRLPAGVAQSVRATPFSRTVVRRGPTPSRLFFGGEVGPPCGGLQGGGLSSSSISESRSEAAGRASAPGTRAAALSRAPAMAALMQGVQLEGGVAEATGARILEAFPELAALPVEIVAREAWRLLSDGGDGRLSASSAEQLRRSSSQIERTGYGSVLPGPGASRAAVIDLALGDWRDWWHIRRPSDRPPVTLGGLTCCLRKLARRCAKGARTRRRARAGAARG